MRQGLWVLSHHIYSPHHISSFFLCLIFSCKCDKTCLRESFNFIRSIRDGQLHNEFSFAFPNVMMLCYVNIYFNKNKLVQLPCRVNQKSPIHLYIFPLQFVHPSIFQTSCILITIVFVIDQAIHTAILNVNFYRVQVR